MPFNVPSDFDADWYLTTYPDVALSGLSPKQHYRRFGKLMGRSPNRAGLAEEPLEVEELDSLQVTPAEPDEQPIASPRPSFAIIDRPSGFDVAEVLPRTTPQRQGRGPDDTISYEALAEGPFPDSGDDRICAPLFAYARMFRLPWSSRSAEFAICGPAFRTGDTRIDNLWFADRSHLRMQLAGGSGEQSNRWVLRAYQASPSDPGALRVLGAGIELPLLGPAFYDLQLLHPLMPVLLEYSDEENRTQAMALLAFPSLLPGGLHWAELKALQTEPNPTDEFWSRSESLLQKLCDQPDQPPRSIVSITFDAGTSESGPMRSAEMQAWLARLFGLHVVPSMPSSETASKSLVFSTTAEAEGTELVLPEDCLPTISALVARHSGQPVSNGSAQHFLIVSAEGLKPRWSVVLPCGDDAVSGVPFLRPARASASVGLPPGPAAIAIRQSRRSDAIGRPISDFGKLRGTLPALSVVLDASDASLTSEMSQLLRDVGELAPLQLLVRLSDSDVAIRSELDRSFGPGGWASIPQRTDLREVACGAQHDRLLALSDRIRFHDPGTLSFLCALLDADETAGSVSCALFSEKIIKRQAVLEPAVGGLFPTRVSFSAAPHLSFGEPDVLEALPDLTYPVVANSLFLTVFRSGALATLPSLPAGAAPNQDIRLGLDLMEAGYRSWCTTKVLASLSGHHVRRDSIDPVGGRYSELRRWENILDRVALVREIF